MPDKTSQNSGHMFSVVHWIEYINSKKQIRFTLNNDHEENRKKIELIRLDALRIKFTRDTNTVIRIHLSNDINYHEFVTLINICYADNLTNWITWDNNFIIAHYEPPFADSTTAVPAFVCGYQGIPDGNTEQRSAWKIVNDWLKEHANSANIKIAAGYLTLLLSYLYFIRRKRNKLKLFSSTP